MSVDVELDILVDSVKLSFVSFDFCFLKLIFIFSLLNIQASCSSTYCSNGGTCVMATDGINYKCACPAGYTGDQCTSAVYSMFLCTIERGGGGFLFSRLLCFPTMSKWRYMLSRSIFV